MNKDEKRQLRQLPVFIGGIHLLKKMSDLTYSPSLYSCGLSPVSRPFRSKPSSLSLQPSSLLFYLYRTILIGTQYTRLFGKV